MVIEKIKEFAISLGYEEINKIKNWNGYEVYELYTEGAKLGMFRCALIKGKEMRKSTDEEAFEILEAQ